MFSKTDQEWNYASQKITIILQQVKMKLMSRELEQQKEAVAWLIGELNANSPVRNIFVTTLFKSEIIALLCETTMTMHGHLVPSTLKCLASLTISEIFYKQNHASYVIASILRAGHFLTLESNLSKDQLIILESIACTLEKIFEGANNFRVSQEEICELIQILRFFKKLLTAESQTYRIVFSASKILSFVLQCTRNYRYFNLESESENGELVFTVIETALKLMRKILEAKNPTDGKYAFRAMVMICAVSAAGISLSSQSSDSDTLTKKIGLLKSSGINYRANIADCIYSAMMKSVIPNFNKIDQDERNGHFYMWFVTCLNGLYEMNYRKLKDLSNYLAEQGFLQILPRLTMLPISSLRNETFLLLSRILTILASVSLSIETWLGGAKQFQKFLINAFKSLPPDPSTWLSFLSEGDARSDSLIILFYYNFLRESSSTVAVYLPQIIAYIMSSTSLGTRRKSTTILKSLWLTFSIAAVSHEDPTTIDSYESGMSRLFNDIESADIKQCYSHHPAVLIHCLKSTSIVSEKLRAGVICLWLENGGDIRCIVDATVEGDLANYYCLLEMVKTGAPQTVDIAMKAISGLIQNPEAVRRLGIIMWEILQQILAPGYNREGHNITSILKLAAIFEPNEMSGSLLVRLLYCLTIFILENESDLNLVSLGIKNAYCLLLLSIRRKDIRGITMFTNKPELIKILKTLAFGNKDAGLSYVCFNCLSTLIRYQEKYSVQCENTLEIESEELLQQLYREQSFGAVKLAADLFTSVNEKPLIALKGLFERSDCDLTIRGIYLQFHIIHSRSGPEDRNFCYASLVGMLNHCEAINDRKVLKILCEMEWTHLLIEITLNGKHDMNPHFMDFVSQWLSYRFFVSPMSPPCKNRACGRDQFETTLDLLGRAALTKFSEEPKDESLRELVQSLTLFQAHFSGDIGNDLEQADKELSTTLN